MKKTNKLDNMGLEIHYFKLFNTIEYYEQVLYSSYEEMINLVGIIMKKNELIIKFEDYEVGDDVSKAELEVFNDKGILMFSSNKYYVNFNKENIKSKYNVYCELFQSDFFKGLPK